VSAGVGRDGEGGFEAIFHVKRHFYNLPFPVEADVFGPSGGYEKFVFLPEEPVAEGQAGSAQIGECGLDDDSIVITGRSEIATGDLDYRKVHPLFFN
jgi:hypothetical protein